MYPRWSILRSDMAAEEDFGWQCDENCAASRAPLNLRRNLPAMAEPSMGEDAKAVPPRSERRMSS